jgi:prepilin signal peptidase PulO-like enzyme (type II secretory pathway)
MVHWSSGFPGAELVLVAMAFIWGAILGSFVNVVIHRLPRGESVVTHGSRCPSCGTAIRPHDNVPILGWLLLGGRCRDCGVAISAGYPAIEAGCGAIAAIIATAELSGVGSPLLAASRPGIDRLLSGDWRIALAWAIHTVIPVAMLAWSLTASTAHATGTEAFRHRPASDGCHAAAVVAAAIMAAVTAVPAIGPQGFMIDGRSPDSLPAWQATFVSSCLGAVAGRLAGVATGLPGDCCGLATFGAAAGWQAVVVVTVVTVGIRLLVAAVRPGEPAKRVMAAAAPAAAATAIFAAWLPVAGAWATCWRVLAPG